MSPELLRRIGERASDETIRTFASGEVANARPVDFATLTEDLRRYAPPAAGRLLGMVGRLGALTKGFGGTTAMAGDGPVRFGTSAEQDLPPPPSADRIADAERTIGASLPEELVALYAIADGGFGPGQGLYSLDAMVAKYRELTATAFGPLDQPWPASLLPIFEDSPGWTSIDLEKGILVYWDPEEIEDEDSEDDWQKSFKTVHACLAEAMEDWLGAPTMESLAETARADFMASYSAAGKSPVTGWPMMLDPETQAHSEIEFLRNSPSLRKDFDLPEEGWEVEVRRRHGVLR